MASRRKLANALLVTQADWIAVAEALHVMRRGAASGWPPGEADASEICVHDRKLIYYATLETIDRAAAVIAINLKARSTRFDARRFLQLVGVQTMRD